MGWSQVTATIYGRRSAHNSINDDLDRVRMEWFIKELRELTNKPQYLSLDITVTDFTE